MVTDDAKKKQKLLDIHVFGIYLRVFETNFRKSSNHMESNSRGVGTHTSDYTPLQSLCSVKNSHDSHGNYRIAHNNVMQAEFGQLLPNNAVFRPPFYH